MEQSLAFWILQNGFMELMHYRFYVSGRKWPNKQISTLCYSHFEKTLTIKNQVQCIHSPICICNISTGCSRFIRSICLLCNTITRHAISYKRSLRKVCLQTTLSNYYSWCSLMNFNVNSSSRHGQRQRKTLFPTEKMMNLSII